MDVLTGKLNTPHTYIPNLPPVLQEEGKGGRRRRRRREKEGGRRKRGISIRTK